MASTIFDSKRISELRNLLVTLKGDIHAREARAVLRTISHFYPGDVDSSDIEAETRIRQSRTYCELTTNLAEEHAAMIEELATLREAGATVAVPKDDESDVGDRSRFEKVQLRISDICTWQDQAISDLERFIEDEESETRNREREGSVVELEG